MLIWSKGIREGKNLDRMLAIPAHHFDQLMDHRAFSRSFPHAVTFLTMFQKLGSLIMLIFVFYLTQVASL